MVKAESSTPLMVEPGLAVKMPVFNTMPVGLNRSPLCVSTLPKFWKSALTRTCPVTILNWLLFSKGVEMVGGVQSTVQFESKLISPSFVMPPGPVNCTVPEGNVGTMFSAPVGAMVIAPFKTQVSELVMDRIPFTKDAPFNVTRLLMKLPVLTVALAKLITPPPRPSLSAVRVRLKAWAVRTISAFTLISLWAVSVSTGTPTPTGTIVLIAALTLISPASGPVAPVAIVTEVPAFKAATIKSTPS